MTELATEGAQWGAIAVHHLGLTAVSEASTRGCDDLLPQRCGLFGLSRATFNFIEKSLGADLDDMSMVLIGHPEVEPFTKLLEAPGLLQHWLRPMKQFCLAHGAALPEQRAQVHKLLCCCGWSDQPDALRLVLDELQWNTLAVLRFALELLRPLYDSLWPALAGILHAQYGAAAVLPLRKLIDPELTLAWSSLPPSTCR